MKRTVNVWLASLFCNSRNEQQIWNQKSQVESLTLLTYSQAKLFFLPLRSNADMNTCPALPIGFNLVLGTKLNHVCPSTV